MSQYNEIVYPSSQVDSTLPQFIVQNYARFVSFMEHADEAQERLGFGQNLLQNIQKYRDFDNYQDDIVEYNLLSKRLIEEDTESLTLEDGFGFPEKNGVVLVGDEVILYDQRVGNVLNGLQRGASGTTVLPTFTKAGVFKDTVATSHNIGTPVKNLSVLFLVAMATTISDSFTDNIAYRRYAREVNKSSLWQNLRDFYQSKGSKLGIKALFKMLFAENDVDVTYPGDRMIIPSRSGYDETQILRTVPVPFVFCDPEENWATPAQSIGAELSLKSYLDDDVEYAKTFVSYVSTYPYESEVQYEIQCDENFLTGDFVSNPKTRLTRAADVVGDGVDQVDVYTITVESTLGFPDAGVIFIEQEAIKYTSRSLNQFFGCTRGYIGVDVVHPVNAEVWGPYYVEARYEKEGVEYVSRSWPLGLVESVEVRDPGSLHTPADEVYINGPGRIDPRDKCISSFIENYDDVLAQQVAAPPQIGLVENWTAGVDGVFFDKRNVFVSSSDLPYDPVGLFSSDDSVGPDLTGNNLISVIPRRETRQPNPFADKGTETIGVFVDGVSAYSNVSTERVTQGKIARIDVTEEGFAYITPTMVVDDAAVTDTTFDIGTNGEIVGVTTESLTNYDGDKRTSSRISSGEDGVIDLTFDVYGRITTATVSNPGRWYYDIPTIDVVDGSGVGKGALLAVTVDGNGGLASVNIVNSGIDYNPIATTAQVIPVGFGADVEAIIQYYEYDKPYAIETGANTQFDGNNGFVFKNKAGKLTNYGYVIAPSKMRENLGDNGTAHSPILGWAFDGNPIYGPTLWKNKKNADGGLIEARSGYVLRTNRDNIIAGGGDDIGTNPPSEDVYPMGTFVQDYEFNPAAVSSQFLLATDNKPDPTGDPLDDADIQTDNTDPNGDPPPDSNILAFLGTIDTTYTIMNVYNGVIANTPEYPEELYPDGVFFYVATTVGLTPIFPYIIGDNFANRPISQNIIAKTTIEPETARYLSFNPSYSYDDTLLEFDFEKIDRFRNPYLESTKDQLKIEVETTLEGTVSGIEVINGSPSTTVVGDYLYYDSTGSGGDGASGIVTYIQGKPVVNGYGSITATTLISHRQAIDCDYFTYNPETNEFYKAPYVFVVGTQIQTTTGSLATVESYDQETRVLIVQTETERLIQVGDIFYDNKGLVVFVRATGLVTFMGPINCVTQTAPSSPATGQFWLNTGSGTVDASWTGLAGTDIEENTPVYWDETEWKSKQLYDGTYENIVHAYGNFISWQNQNNLADANYLVDFDRYKAILTSEANAGRTTFVSETEPETSGAQQGDLWWSINNGRLFVFYKYAVIEPGTGVVTERGQWVCTQPIGTRPLDSASDEGIGRGTTGGQAYTHEMSDNSITIAREGPSARPDGSPNQLGDLWWSNSTGILYFWNTNSLFNLESSEVIRSEWVCTDPNGMIPMEGASDDIDPTVSSYASGTDVYSASVTVIVSPQPPTEQPDGSALTDGLLWWSPLTGKMYIRYTDEDNTVSWAVTNPVGTVPTEGAADRLYPGGENFPEGSVRQLPELPSQEKLWFENLDNFLPGDVMRFEVSAPGIPGATDRAQIQFLLPGNGAIVLRDDSPTFLPDGCPTINTSRYMYTVRTSVPHGLIPGDIVKMQNSSLGLNNEDFIVQEVGTAVAPVGTVTVVGGEVTDIVLTSPGSGYKEDFYIYFYAGGGTGALAFATVSPLEEDGTGGEVTDIQIINSGFGYTGNPSLIWGTELTNTQFRIYTEVLYTGEVSFSYSTTSEALEGMATIVEPISGGIGYDSLPTAIGLYKRSVDRASTKIKLEGTTIDSVEVLYGGARYQSPIAIFGDYTNMGSGASASVTVTDGKVTAVTMTSSGTQYVEPYLVLVESGGKFVSTTTDIGRVKSFKVLDPGRNISPDRTLKPELMLDTKCVVKFQSGGSDEFVPGEPVYQGIPEDKLFTAVVKDYKNSTQEVTLTFNPNTLPVEYGGVLKAGELLIGEQSGAVAMVLQQGQADCVCVVDGVSAPDGRFVNDEGMLSERYAVIQDSNYFQWFSYVISSPMQRADYETFVNDIIHPVGFALFSNVTINESVKSGSFMVSDNPVETTTFPLINLSMSLGGMEKDVPVLITEDGQFELDMDHLSLSPAEEEEVLDSTAPPVEDPVIEFWRPETSTPTPSTPSPAPTPTYNAPSTPSPAPTPTYNAPSTPSPTPTQTQTSSPAPTPPSTPAPPSNPPSGGSGYGY